MDVSGKYRGLSTKSRVAHGDNDENRFERSTCQIDEYNIGVVPYAVEQDVLAVA
jgi:hypothetical protein